MNTTAKTAATPATQPRPFNFDRAHTVGQYLNFDQDAKRVVVGNRRESDKEFFSLKSRAVLR
jgi:hypothetical protein